MDKKEIHAVTGAFGYSGRYIATRLLEQGRTVITLTNSVNRANPFGGKVRCISALIWRAGQAGGGTGGSGRAV